MNSTTKSTMMRDFEEDGKRLVGYYDREWEYHRFTTPGWSDGSQDIEVSVLSGSPAKAIIIHDGARKMTYLYNGKMKRIKYSSIKKILWVQGSGSFPRRE